MVYKYWSHLCDFVKCMFNLSNNFRLPTLPHIHVAWEEAFSKHDINYYSIADDFQVTSILF